MFLFRKSLEVAEDYNDVFYSSLMEGLEENFDEDAYLVCIIILGDVTRGSHGHSVRWANLLEQQLVITVPPVRRASWNYHYIDLLNSTKLNLISLRATQNPKIIISKATRN